MEIPVNAIEEKDGEPVYNLSNSAANDDWIRAARLLRQGKTEELEEMQNTQMIRNTQN